jgi:hypothetical protein
MRYRLRTLLILLALAPPALAGVWFFFWDVLYWAAIPALIALGLLATACLSAMVMVAILLPGIALFHAISAAIRLVNDSKSRLVGRTGGCGLPIGELRPGPRK